MTSIRPWYRRPSRVIPAALAALGVVAVAAAVISPWPMALLIRAMFEQDGATTATEMQGHVPNVPLQETLDVSTGVAGASFDAFSPVGFDGPLPTVVWIHGGAWISGSKETVRPYAQIIATQGYTAIALDYTVAPEATYPVALEQLNSTLAYLVENADDLRIDPTRIVLAGDSAGANLASQLAVLTTNPAAAAELGITPALQPEQLVGMVLDCGIYDVEVMASAGGIGGLGFSIALWAYLGDRNWSSTIGATEMSTLDWVTADFPPTWISGGNADPLTDLQSKPLATKLTGLDVPVTELFYPADHEPALGHEYQFHLDLEDARGALDSTLAFLATVTASS